MRRGKAREWDPSHDWRHQRLERIARTAPAARSAAQSHDPTTDPAHPADPASAAVAVDWPESYRFDPQLVTHVITGTITFTEYDDCGDPQADGIAHEADPDRATVVSPSWVIRSYALGYRQPERYYSPDPARIFSGIIVHPSRMSTSETELILAAVTSLGG